MAKCRDNEKCGAYQYLYEGGEEGTLQYCYLGTSLYESSACPGRYSYLKVHPSVDEWADSLIQYGNWCGPNWTAGQNQSSRDYRLAGGDFTDPCIDEIDCACRDHDQDCSHDLGCSRSGDMQLITEMSEFRSSSWNPILSARAQAIQYAVLAAMPFRER